MFGRRTPTLSLPVAYETGEVTDFNEALLTGDIPGFQIEPKIFDETTTLAALAEQTRTVVPDFSFNHLTDSQVTNFGNEWEQLPKERTSRSFDNGLHFDTGLQGIAVHINKGAGSVLLQATTPEKYVTGLLRKASGFVVRYSSFGEGPQYRGSLSPGLTITVFAEDMLLHGGRSAALHHFKKAPTSWRHWRRFTFMPPEFKSTQGNLSTIDYLRELRK